MPAGEVSEKHARDDGLRCGGGGSSGDGWGRGGGGKAKQPRARFTKGATMAA